MSRVTIRFLLVLGAIAVSSCFHSQTPDGFAVEASIASVTLGEDCPASEPSRLGDCAPGFTDCGFCQQSTVLLAIDAEDAERSPASFEVLEVRLHAADGAFLQRLDARNARVFDGESYVEWDEQIAPGASLNVIYDTSAPDWNAIGGGDAYTTYGMSFRIVMRIRIDGAERTIDFEPAAREPQIVT
jgi:hypothetical protein